MAQIQDKVVSVVTYLTRERRRWKVVSVAVICIFMFSNVALIPNGKESNVDDPNPRPVNLKLIRPQYPAARFVEGDGVENPSQMGLINKAAIDKGHDPLMQDKSTTTTTIPPTTRNQAEVQVEKLNNRVHDLEAAISELNSNVKHFQEENERLHNEEMQEIEDSRQEVKEEQDELKKNQLELAKQQQLDETGYEAVARQQKQLEEELKQEHAAMEKREVIAMTTAKQVVPTSRPTPAPSPPTVPPTPPPTTPKPIQATPKPTPPPIEPAVVAEAVAVKVPTNAPPVVSKCARPWNGTRCKEDKVYLNLSLPAKYLHRPEFSDKDATFRRFGFDLRTSNNISLDRDMADLRSEGCKAIPYPPLEEMPSVSVIVIYYNEAMSTLLRLIVSVINNSPSQLLKEIVLINDNSTLDELVELPAHLEKLRASTAFVPPIRSIYRAEHTGIVGARIVGAKAATQDIIIFLDSHCETTPGWLEPMVARIHEDRTRVIVPIVRGFNINTLQIFNNEPWPPSKGVFNWRVNYKPVMADPELDLLDPAHPFESPVRNPVMPGGLFAMDRKFFFDIGAYDPHLMYYGAEHVEMSLRIWMCGGSMEVLPCSNVGHIFREFNRFDEKADPLINKKDHKLDMGKILNRNDARVGNVWMDQYNSVFYRQRALEGIDLGEEIQDRRDLRTNLKCHNFQWFLDNVNVPQFYVPDINATVLSLRNSDSKTCLDAGESFRSAPTMTECKTDTISTYDRMRGMTGQLWSYTSKKRIQTAFYINNKEFQCLRANRISLTTCGEGSLSWTFDERPNGLVRPRTILRGAEWCMERRVDLGDTSVTKLAKCGNTSRQLWRLEDVAGVTGSVHILGSTPGWGGTGACLDNMQRTRGGFGYYNCHRGNTQQWKVNADGKIQSTFSDDTCIGITPTVEQFMCIGNDVDQDWIEDGKTFHPGWDKSLCLSRTETKTLGLKTCDESEAQIWERSEKVLEYGVGVTGGLRYN